MSARLDLGQCRIVVIVARDVDLGVLVLDVAAVEQKLRDRVLLQASVDDLSRKGTDIGPTVSADLCFVPNASKR